MSVESLIPTLGRQKQVDHCEFEVNLVYTASSRTGTKATQRNPVLKNKNNKKLIWHEFVAVAA